MLAIDEFDKDLVEELRDRARDVLLTKAISLEEELVGVKPNQDLLEVEGMEESLAYQLAAKGIVTREDLADQELDDLMQMSNLDEKKAGKLIMAARAHWFEEAEKNLETGKQ
jgi:N utilization substance protein A